LGLFAALQHKTLGDTAFPKWWKNFNTDESNALDNIDDENKIREQWHVIVCVFLHAWIKGPFARLKAVR